MARHALLLCSLLVLTSISLANVSGQDIKDVAEFMNSSDFDQLFIEGGLTLGEILSTRLQSQGSTPEKMNKTMEGLERRIESIINKISGENIYYVTCIFASIILLFILIAEKLYNDYESVSLLNISTGVYQLTNHYQVK